MKKMNFEFLVEYIEDYEMSTEIANKKLNEFIYEEFKNIEVKDYSNLFYILIAINIRSVELNEFSKKIYNDILEFYKTNELKLGLKITEWYKNSDNIRECIDEILEKTNNTMKDLNINLLNNLIKKETYSDIRKKLVDYLMEFVSNIEIFDLDIYKKMIFLKNHFEYNSNSLNAYIYKTCKEKNVFKEYIKKCINENIEFNSIDSLIAFYVRAEWLNLEVEELFASKIKEDGVEIEKNKFIRLIEDKCKNNNIDFYNTLTCKAILYNYIFNYGTTCIIDRQMIENYIIKHKDEILYNREAYEIINEQWINRNNENDYKYLCRYEKTIENRLQMGEEEKRNFLIDLNRYKYENGIIPFEICKYIIYCFLQYNEFNEIIECVLCDFAKGIELQNGINEVHNFVESDENMISMNGMFRTKTNSRKYVLLKEKLIGSFSRDNIKIIETIYHEIEHIIQDRDIDNKNWTGNRFKMYIEERILLKKIKNYEYLNYYDKYTEIEARYAGAVYTKKFIEELNISWEDLYIERNGEKENALKGLNDMIEECRALLLEADFKYINDINQKENMMDYYKKNFEMDVIEK